MKNYFYFIFLSVLIRQTYQLCGKGCLSCVQNECQFCNDKKNYYLNNQTKTCELIYINHCTRSINGHCVQCEQDFILQTQANKSVICNPVSKKIDNCEIYKSPILCKRCKPGYYIYQNGITCVKYIQKIDNCYQHSYADENTVQCQLCQNGFVLSEDKKECIKYDSDPNCLIASNFYCQECKQGYVPKSSLFNNMPVHERDLTLFHDIFAVEKEPYRQTSLIKCVNSQQNCLKYKTKIVMEQEESTNENEKVQFVKKEYVVCAECKKYHYLQQIDEKKFVCNKSVSVLNCEVYKNQDTCKRCESGYFLNNQGKCEQTKEIIPNCKYYQSETQCQICHSEYMLLKSGEHKEGYAVENFFKILQKISEKPFQTDDFVYQNQRLELEELYKNSTIQQMNLGLDLNVLFGDIKNFTQKQEDSQERKLSLDIDNNTYHKTKSVKYMQSKEFKNLQLQSLVDIDKPQRFLEQDQDSHVKLHLIYLQQQKILSDILKNDLAKSLQCFKYTISNCAKYNNGSCIYCNNNYYLLNNVCKKIEQKIQNCQIYYQENQCAQCKNGFILYNNKCFRMNPIYNCERKVFSENGKCLLCKSGYFYDMEKEKCVENKKVQEMKCLIFSSLSETTCYLCDQNHFMGSDSKCYSEEVPLTGTIIGHHQKLKELI